jgi:hypothetical protein
VATNHHLNPTLFVNNSFWLTAYSERRFLVEAWGYTPRSVEDAARWRVGAGGVPFWDPDLLARNEAVFLVPTAENVGWLRRRGVRWLVADTGAGPVSQRLADFALPRVAGGSITVYELVDAPARQPGRSTGSGTTATG